MNDEEPFKALYYEPYYQLMCQTLLDWKMVSANEYGADDYIHINFIPDENHEMLRTITSKELQKIKNQSGDEYEPLDMEDAWECVLKDHTKYKRISPQWFLKPLRNEKDTKSLLQYLYQRYWQ
jgi:hypothetical protein